MEKKSILTLLLFSSFITFALSQDVSHTPTSIGLQTYPSFDSRFMEKMLAENPSLSNRWNLEPVMNWSENMVDFETFSTLFPSNRVQNVDSNALFAKERERTPQMRIDLRNLNDIESRPFNYSLYLPLINVGENLR